MGAEKGAPAWREDGEGGIVGVAVSLGEDVLRLAVVEGEGMDVEPAIAKGMDLSLYERVREARVQGGEVGQPDPGWRPVAARVAHGLARPGLLSVASIAET